VEQEKAYQSKRWWEKYSSIILRIHLGLTFISICCILQFFIVGIINLSRGYSIGTRLPEKILLAGLFAFIPLSVKYLKKLAIFGCYSLTVSFVLMYVCWISLAHVKYIEEAKEYYSTGQYQQALLTYEKEIQTWYHLLKYNFNERIAMNMIAKTYCQLGDFDSARDTYNLMIDRYPGEYYAGRAQESLVEMEEGLKIVANYPDKVPETKGFPVDLYNIARAYRYDLNCYRKAIEVYTKIVDMDISDECKKSAKESILKLTVDANKN